MFVRNLQAEWARTLIGSLAEAGVREVVISPGSRSTPFVLAAVAQEGLRCLDVIDERSAGYFALGQARVTGRPTLLIATSGTAGANYLPAVVEAGVAHVPLLVLTADRPVELVGCGANQTIDQIKLFGHHAREFFDLGAPEGSPRALRALRRVAAQAVFAACAPNPGAVHLNARIGKPLEPAVTLSEEELDFAARVTDLLAHPGPRPLAPRHLPQPVDIEELAKCCRRHEHGLIVCGPAPLAHAEARSLVAELGRRTGYPVLREATSQLRYCAELAAEDIVVVDSFDALLKSGHFRASSAPELIIQIGRFPTSKSWAAFLAERAGCRHWLLGADGWSDAESSATELLFAELEPSLALLTTRLPARRSESSWCRRWRKAEAVSQRVLDEELAAAEDLSEGRVARTLVDKLPPGSLLAVGNSLPIREVDTYSRGRDVDIRVWSQRGASGIDGVLSGVFGAASVWRHRVALLIGDVSFLHDLSGLHAARHVGVPVVIVVVQNRGGRIFEQLPLASNPVAEGSVLDHWTTPHELDFTHAAALFGFAYHRVEDPGQLEEALAAGFEHPGVSVVEAIVPPHGASEENRRVWARIDAALVAGEGG